jgi:uncharacterized OsmC-like protein
MTTTTVTMETNPGAGRRKPLPEPLNGVNTPVLLTTINAVAAQPELAKFVFRASNSWLQGTHSRSTMAGFFGAGGEHKHIGRYTAEADHPAVLCGADRAPTPVEFVLHALASCLMSGFANISAARGVKLNSVDVTVEGDIDLRGILGISDEVRNGYENIRVTFDVDADATPEKIRSLVDQARARSAVYDVVTRGVPVTIGTKEA